MIRRDVLTRRRDTAIDKVNSADRIPRADEITTVGTIHDTAGSRNSDMHIELETADHEEPTWEVRRSSVPRRRRLDRRTRWVLAFAVVAAVVVNAAAAWTYWEVNSSETGQAAAGGALSVALRARSDANQPLLPQTMGNLTVTVTNDYDHPIRITSVAPGIGKIVADPEHRAAGCEDTPVSITKPRFPVAWDVQRNSLGAFIVGNALVMRADADPACRGATFTVPLRAFGTRRVEP